MSMTPYEIMLAAKETGTTPQIKRQGRPRLSDEQRAARKVANRLASRRAYYVLRWKYRAELADIATTERRALYALIDQQYTAGQPIVLPEN